MERGFTLLETLMVVAIMMILAGVSLPVIFSFQKNSELQNFSAEVLSDFRLARGRALSAEENSKWGISFDETTTPNQYVVFCGESFALRDVGLDEVHQLPRRLEFLEINFLGNEVVFSKINGLANTSGSLEVSIIDNPTKIRTIYLASSGLASMDDEILLDDGRLKDSRHIHFVYTRVIDTLTENIILTFPGESVVETIPIASNLVGGQIEWQGEIDVGGDIQIIKVHTHYLNDPLYGTATMFCLHRDKRYNNKAMRVDISGDPNYPALSPVLVDYSFDGATTPGNSAFVSEILWQ